YHLQPNCLDDVTVVLDGGANQVCGKIAIDNAGGSTAVQWSGQLEITSRDSRVIMNLSYVQRPDGQWTGDMHYFGTFETTGLDTWIASTTKGLTGSVQNGLIKRWGALRMGGLEGWNEFMAVLTATRTGSWAQADVMTRCKKLPGSTPSTACYPY